MGAKIDTPKAQFPFQHSLSHVLYRITRSARVRTRALCNNEKKRKRAQCSSLAVRIRLWNAISLSGSLEKKKKKKVESRPRTHTHSHTSAQDSTLYNRMYPRVCCAKSHALYSLAETLAKLYEAKTDYRIGICIHTRIQHPERCRRCACMSIALTYPGARSSGAQGGNLLPDAPDHIAHRCCRNHVIDRGFYPPPLWIYRLLKFIQLSV